MTATLSSLSGSIEEVRQLFEKEICQNGDLYHPIDIERVRNEEWQVKRFLDEYSTRDQAFESMINALRWKKQFGIHDRSDQYFPKEIWELNGVEVSGQDNNKRFLQWESYRNQKVFKELKPLALQFIAHVLERVDRMAGQNGFVLVMDINGALASNLDIDLIKYKLSIINYYPGSLKQLWVVDLPWLLNPIMTMILALLSPKLREIVVYLKSKDLPKYMDVEQIPKSLGGKREKQSMPDNLIPLSHMMEQLQLTDKFIDSFYSSYKMKRPA